MTSKQIFHFIRSALRSTPSESKLVLSYLVVYDILNVALLQNSFKVVGS